MATKRQSYYATLRALRAGFDLTWREAQATWRAVVPDLVRRPVAKDVARHPRVTLRAVTKVRRELPPPLPTTGTETDEYEITWRYQEQETGKRHHITIRAIGPAGATNEEVRRVFWRALNGKP